MSKAQLLRLRGVTGFVTLLLIWLVQVVGEESINAYIPAHHKVMFDEYNAMVFGDLSVAKAAFRGALAVQRKAEMSDFDIAADKTCDNDVRSLVVGGSLTARSGTVHNGYTVVGRWSRIHHSVRLPCTNRVERHDPMRNGDIDFDEARRALSREAARMCLTKPTGTITVENSTMIFQPEAEETFSCYTYFLVKTTDLRLITVWQYNGEDYYRNVVITVSGSRAEFRNFRMLGFNPKRTLIVFCTVYGSYTVADAKLHASIFAPTASLSTMNAIINGSIIVGNLRGSIATLNMPYVTC